VVIVFYFGGNHLTFLKKKDIKILTSCALLLTFGALEDTKS